MIPEGVRFLVCLPTPLNAMGGIVASDVTLVEPAVEETLQRERARLSRRSRMRGSQYSGMLRMSLGTSKAPPVAVYGSFRRDRDPAAESCGLGS